ncbi:hypothetical protein HK096_000148, partial [Nowakowskiella sp. JEL0078]
MSVSLEEVEECASRIFACQQPRFSRTSQLYTYESPISKNFLSPNISTVALVTPRTPESPQCADPKTNFSDNFINFPSFDDPIRYCDVSFSSLPTPKCYPIPNPSPSYAQRITTSQRSVSDCQFCPSQFYQPIHIQSGSNVTQGINKQVDQLFHPPPCHSQRLLDISQHDRTMLYSSPSYFMFRNSSSGKLTLPDPLSPQQYQISPFIQHYLPQLRTPSSSTLLSERNSSNSMTGIGSGYTLPPLRVNTNLTTQQLNTVSYGCEAAPSQCEAVAPLLPEILVQRLMSSEFIDRPPTVCKFCVGHSNPTTCSNVGQRVFNLPSTHFVSDGSCATIDSVAVYENPRSAPLKRKCGDEVQDWGMKRLCDDGRY